MFSGLNVTLLVSGSIACYKSAELLRELQRRGSKVQVAMSSGAQAFVTPLTFQTLSGFPVVTELFDNHLEHEIGHIALADKADIIICAPASANVLAKVSHGIADDIISTVVLASRSPVLFVPAMNVNMWQSKVTQDNVSRIRELGHFVLEPAEGPLACGWIGAGRFPELEIIIDTINFVLKAKDLRGTRVVVSAGPTTEKLDPIRYLSNVSTGKMGYAIARVARWLGAEVTLVTGPTNIAPPIGVKVIQVESADEMAKAMQEECSRKVSKDIKLQLVYMAAAVSDHRPDKYSTSKIKKDKDASYDITFSPCPDILAGLGNSRKEIEKKSGVRLILVGFTAETGKVEDLIKTARDKREKKKCDMIVGNLAEESFGLDSARVWLIPSSGKEEELAVQDKHIIADRLIKSTLKLV